MGRLANNIGLLLILLFTTIQTNAQENLSKRISLNVYNQTIEDALLQVEKVAEVQFSYNPDHFEVDEITTLECHNLMLKDVLIQLLGNNIELKVIGLSTVIIRSVDGNKEVKKYKYDVTGIVFDSHTGNKLSEVTIYEVDGVRSAHTSKNGTYHMKLVSNKEFVELVYRKRDYQDEVIIVKPSANQNYKIGLEPNRIDPVKPKKTKELERAKSRSIDSSRLVKIVVPKKQRWLTKNIPFLTEPQPIQLSLLPTLGTNQEMNAVMENKVSFNILAGYSRAVNGVEFGGLLNIVRDSVTGAQFAGFGNVVGKNIEGVQAAGFFNHVNGDVFGSQIAGFSNMCLDTLEGVQAAGFVNIANGPVTGGQIAGYLNLATHNLQGVQASGFLNIVGDTLRNVQLAGFANYAKYVEGYQLSGFINVAKKVKGLQFGVVNIADSVKGATIGLFNFVRHGYHPLELSYTDYGSLSLRWKTGTRAFYNFIEAGLDVNNNNFWHYNYGFGHSFKIKEKRSYADMELSSGVINPKEGFNDRFNLINRLEILLSYRLIGPIYIFAGPALNVYLYDKEMISPLQYEDRWIDSTVYETLSMDSWWGYRFGIRI